MAYNDQIGRASNGSNLIPQQISYDILKLVQNESVAMQLFPRVSMGTNQADLPCLSALPVAYFREGDTGLRQTTSVSWDKKFLKARPISCIVPISKDLMSDMSVSAFGQVAPLIAQAVARTLDNAIFFNVNKPSEWPTAIVADAVSHSNTITRGTSSSAAGGLATDISNLMAKIEGQGFSSDGNIANVTYKGYLRNARGTTGNQFAEISTEQAYGNKIFYPLKGLWPTGSGSAEFITGDFTNGLLGVREDMYYEVWKEAMIQDADGKIIYNLPQQNMVALVIDCRFAWQVANIINWQQQTAASRYPWAVMLAP